MSTKSTTTGRPTLSLTAWPSGEFTFKSAAKTVKYPNKKGKLVAPSDICVYNHLKQAVEDGKVSVIREEQRGRGRATKIYQVTTV